jgi:hypothetical protein
MVSIRSLFVCMAVALLVHTTQAYLPTFNGRLQARDINLENLRVEPNAADTWSVGPLSASELREAQFLNEKLDAVIEVLSSQPVQVETARQLLDEVVSVNWILKVPNGLKVNTRLKQANAFLDIPESGPRYSLAQLLSLKNDFVEPSIQATKQ